MNAVFHLVAVLGLGALLGLYLRSQNTVRWLVEWLGDGAGTNCRVRVDHPSRYLERLGRALQLPVDIRERGADALRPMRGGGMLALMLGFGMRSIGWQGSHADVLERLEIRTVRPVTETGKWSQRLLAELGCPKGAEVLFICEGAKS